MSENFYQAARRDDVRLVTDRIAAAEPAGAPTADGARHALDVLMLATGFDTHRFFRPMRVIGQNRVELDRTYNKENLSYLGVTTPALPNWFMIGGRTARSAISAGCRPRRPSSAASASSSR